MIFLGLLGIMSCNVSAVPLSDSVTVPECLFDALVDSVPPSPPSLESLECVPLSSPLESLSFFNPCRKMLERMESLSLPSSCVVFLLPDPLFEERTRGRDCVSEIGFLERHVGSRVERLASGVFVKTLSGVLFPVSLDEEGDVASLSASCVIERRRAGGTTFLVISSPLPGILSSVPPYPHQIVDRILKPVSASFTLEWESPLLPLCSPIGIAVSEEERCVYDVLLPRPSLSSQKGVGTLSFQKSKIVWKHCSHSNRKRARIAVCFEEGDNLLFALPLPPTFIHTATHTMSREWVSKHGCTQGGDRKKRALI